jgi:hypothetical protein
MAGGQVLTIKNHNVELLCKWIKSMEMDLSRTDKGFKECYISNEMDRREDQQEDESVGSEHNCEDDKAETDHRNSEQTKTDEAE